MSVLTKSMLPVESAFHQMRTNGVDLSNYNGLQESEKALVSGAIDSRKAEFGDARTCAHSAIAELTGAPSLTPILRGRRGMPVWPEPVIGSMTHTDGFRAAVVSPRSLVRSIGIDAELAQPLPAGVVDSISTPQERKALKSWGVDFGSRLLFCAKEATYKAWYPVTGKWLGFEDAQVDLHPDGTFISYILLRPTTIHFIEGNWSVEDGYVIATAVVR